jgi:hypothetical protein
MSPTPPPPQQQDPFAPKKDLAGKIGWGLLIAVAAVMLVVRLMNGGGGC